MSDNFLVLSTGCINIKYLIDITHLKTDGKKYFKVNVLNSDFQYIYEHNKEDYNRIKAFIKTQDKYIPSTEEKHLLVYNMQKNKLSILPHSYKIDHDEVCLTIPSDHFEVVWIYKPYEESDFREISSGDIDEIKAENTKKDYLGNVAFGNLVEKSNYVLQDIYGNKYQVFEEHNTIRALNSDSDTYKPTVITHYKINRLY